VGSSILGGPSGPVPIDLSVEATAPVWEGVEQGWGCLRGRRVTVRSSGRRVPRPRQVDVWLPGPGGGVAAVTSDAAVATDAMRDEWSGTTHLSSRTGERAGRGAPPVLRPVG
jgi:hypothetical protein